MQGHVRETVHADAAIHAISDVFPVFIYVVERIEDSRHHGHRAETGIVKYFVMELLVGGAAMNVQGYGDHVRLLAELSHDSGMAVLNERAHSFGRIHDFESIERRG